MGAGLEALGWQALSWPSPGLSLSSKLPPTPQLLGPGSFLPSSPDRAGGKEGWRVPAGTGAEGGKGYLLYLSLLGPETPAEGSVAPGKVEVVVWSSLMHPALSLGAMASAKWHLQ